MENSQNKAKKMKKGQFLEAFSSGNVEKLLHLVGDLPECEKQDLLILEARWNNCKHIMSPLSAAIIAKNYLVSKLLIEDGAPLEQTFQGQYHPLSLALYHDQSNIAEIIIENGADVKKIEYDGTSAVFWAIQKKHPPHITEQILSAGCSPNSIALELLQFRPIHSAVMENNLDIVKLLLNYSVDLNVATSQGETPLLIAVKLNHFEIVKLLVQHGADLYNKNGSISPLLLAIKHKHLKMAETLLDFGASIEKGWVNKIFYSPLFFAIGFALNEDMIKMLLSRGASTSLNPDMNGESPLHAICSDILDLSFKSINLLRSVQVKIAKILIDYGADINAADLEGDTPLHVAILKENREISTFLLKHGAKLSEVKCFKNDDGSPITAFECIVCLESLATPELIKLCLEQGADYNYRNRFGLTMYHCVEKYDNEDMIKCFWHHGCPYDQEKHMPGKITSKLWRSPSDKIQKLVKIQSNFLFGVKKGNLGLVLKAVDNGAEPKGCSMEIPSTLHYVASKGYHDLARLLLEKGVPVNRLNCEGVTALYLAVQGGHLKTCEVLLEFGACYCHRGSVDNKGIELLVKSHQDISKVFKKISKCFKLTKLGDSSVLKVVLDCGEVMLLVLMNCVNRQGLTLTGLSLRLGHSGLATDLMALRIDQMIVKN